MNYDIIAYDSNIEGEVHALYDVYGSSNTGVPTLINFRYGTIEKGHSYWELIPPNSDRTTQEDAKLKAVKWLQEFDFEEDRECQLSSDSE